MISNKYIHKSKNSKLMEVFFIMETMTVTRALAELKLLDSRIHKAFQESMFIAITTGKKPVIGYEKNEDFSEKVKSKYQSIRDLIERRKKIKSAIVKSNAENKVIIGEVEYSVAEAIERKNAIQYEQALLSKLRQDYSNAVRKFEQEEERVKERLDKHLESIFGRDVKIEKGAQKEESDIFLERNEPKLIDPLNLKDEIERLENEINNFLLNVDFVLSEANSLNKITIN